MHESDYNIQKIAYLKETYQQMALYQSEKAKADVMRNSAAAAVSTKKLSIHHGQDPNLMSYVTLDTPAEKTLVYCEGGNNSLHENTVSSNKGYRSG